MNKLKLLLLGVIGLLTISFNATNALTFKGQKNTENLISGHNGFSYKDYNNGFYGCIFNKYKTNANLKRESAGCSDGYYDIYSSDSSNGALMINRAIKYSHGGYKLYAKRESSDIFSLPKYRNGEEVIYKKITMKNLQTKMLNVASQRGENVYDEAFVDGIGFVALVKDENQVRTAHVIANSYILDGYLLAITPYTSYIIDTYINKIYLYKNNFYSAEMQKEGVAQIFPKLWNTVPDEISDVVRGAPMGNNIMVNNQQIFFSIENTQTGTKATLAELRENIKKSIVILDQEGAEFFLGQTPESLGIGAGKPSTDNQANTSGRNEENFSYEESLKEYNSCMSYWNNVKIYTTYDRECYRSLLDSAPLTGSYNANNLIQPWNLISDWDGVSELDIGTEERACLIYKQRKEVYMKKRSSQWKEFEETSKEYWLNPSQISVSENCGGRPERKTNTLGKMNDKYQDIREYIELKTACAFSFGFAPEVCKKLDDPNSSNSIIAENNKDKDVLGSGKTDPLLNLSGIVMKTWGLVYDPFYSGYVNTNFVACQSGSYKNDAFNIFLYLFLFSLFVYFYRFI